MKVLSIESAKLTTGRVRPDASIGALEEAIDLVGQEGTNQAGGSPQRETSSGVEKRSAPRLEPSRVPFITGVHLLPDDVDATLLNISTSGILVECGARPRPGTAVNVRLEGEASTLVPGRVARTLVAALGTDGALRYQVGIAFNAPISIQEAASPANAGISDVPEPSPRPAPRPAELRNRW